MKRSFQTLTLVVLGTALVACTYGLVRYAYGLSVPAAQRDLGLSTSAVGLVSGATSAAYCLATGLASWTCGRWPRAVVTGAGTVAAVGALGAGLATGAGLFTVAVVVGSAGAGAASPGLVVLVRRAVAGPGEDRAQGVVNSGTGPGLVVAGLLALQAGPEWQRGWLAAAVVTAVVTVALLGVSPGPSPGDRDEDRRPDVSTAWVRPVLAAVLLGGGSAAVWTYGRSVLEEGGSSPAAAIWAWVCLGAGATAAAVVAPRLLRRGVPIAWTASALGTSAATVAFAVPAWGPLPWLAAVLFGLAFTTGTTVLIAWASRVSTTPGPAVAALFTGLLLGQAVGGPLAGVLLPHGTVLAFALAAVPASMAATLAASGAAGLSRADRMSR